MKKRSKTEIFEVDKKIFEKGSIAEVSRFTGIARQIISRIKHTGKATKPQKLSVEAWAKEVEKH